MHTHHARSLAIHPALARIGPHFLTKVLSKQDHIGVFLSTPVACEFVPSTVHKS
jgi:hypothetical protein